MSKAKSRTKTTKNSSKYKLGDFVLLNNDREGIIGYKGTLHKNPKNTTFYGIELLNGAIGDSDGIYSGKRYFQTLPNRAIFVKVDAIRRIMVGKDYNAPRRLHRRESLQKVRSSSSLYQSQTGFELAIFDVAKEIETKCDLMDLEEEEEIPDDIKLQNKAASFPMTKKKKKRRGRKRKKGLNKIMSKYEQNARNIDNERNKKLEMIRERKSFLKVKLDGDVKSAAISGFKHKLNKKNQKNIFKNEEKAIKNANEIVKDMGFLKYLKDVPKYSYLFKSKKKKKRRKRNEIKKQIKHYKESKRDLFKEEETSSNKMNAATINKKQRKKRTRKKLQFDDNEGIAVGVFVGKKIGISNTESKMIDIDSTQCKVDDNEYDYDILDMTNSNQLLVLSLTKAKVLHNVICEVLMNMNTLKVIEMSNCGLNDLFMSKICDALINSSSIWCFNIQSNPIGDEGMMSLCKLIENNNECLTHIKIQNNRNDISTNVCEAMCHALEMNEYIKVFEFEFRHIQYRDKCKRVLNRNNERARKLKANKKV